MPRFRIFNKNYKTPPIIKWIVRLIGIFFIVILVAGAWSFFSQPGEPPSVEKAQYAIQTYSTDEFKIPSRIYYAKTIEYIDGIPVATEGYWGYDGELYHHHREAREFTEPCDIIIRRAEE